MTKMKVEILDIAEKVPHNDRALRIGNILSSDKEIRELFGNRWDRMLMGSFTYLITVDNKDAGFINVLHEKDDRSFLVVDMGIKKKYRGKGVGTKAIELLKEKNINQFIVAETKKENTGAIKSLDNVGIKVAESDECSYYLLQTDRVEEFIDKDYLEKLADHYSEENVKLLIK